MTSPLVEVRNLEKHYGTVAVLRGVSLTIAPGERVAILGRSGSGKSTLLHLLGGLDVPSAGSLTVAGQELSTLSRNQRADYRLSTVGIIFQAFHLVPARTAVQNVELPMMFAGNNPHARQEAAKAALVAVGMGHRVTHRPHELSGGEKQRVAVARAMVNRPKLLLADEPTGNLDTATGATVMAVIQEQIQAIHAAMLLITHDEELAQRSCDRVLRMADGVLVAG